MGEVIPLGMVTSLNIPPDRVLENNKGQLKSVLILGFTNEGDFLAASSQADGGEILWLMELCKQRLFENKH